MEPSPIYNASDKNLMSHFASFLSSRIFTNYKMSFCILCRLLRTLELWIYAILHFMHLLVALVISDGIERMRWPILSIFYRPLLMALLPSYLEEGYHCFKFSVNTFFFGIVILPYDFINLFFWKDVPLLFSKLQQTFADSIS